MELTYNYQMKQHLNWLKIKPVDVYFEDLKDLSPVRQIDFYIGKALDSYKEPSIDTL